MAAKRETHRGWRGSRCSSTGVDDNTINRTEVRCPKGLFETVGLDLEMGSVVRIEQGLGASAFILEAREAPAPEKG